MNGSNVRVEPPEPPPPKPRALAPSTPSPTLDQVTSSAHEPPLLELTRTSDLAWTLDGPSAGSHFLIAAGLDLDTTAELTKSGVTPDRARELILHLAQATSLVGFGPRFALLDLLGRVALGEQELDPSELVEALGAYHGLVTARPDGVLVEVSTDEALEVFGRSRSGRQTWPLELGRLYALEVGIVRPVDAWLQPTDGPIVFELGLGRGVVGSLLDGAEDMIRETVTAWVDALRDPGAALTGIVAFPASVVQGLTLAPEFVDQICALPTEAQVRLLGRVLSTALALRAAGGAMSTAVAEARASGGFVLSVQNATAALRLELDATGVLVASSHLALAGALAAPPGVMLAEARGHSAVTAAGLKRLSKALPKAKLVEVKASILKIGHDRRSLMQKLETLLESPGLGEKTRVFAERALNSLRDHLKDEDLVGALRDQVGLPVRRKGSGTQLQHEKEVWEGVRSLEAAQSALAQQVRAAGPNSKRGVALSGLADELIALRLEVRRLMEIP